MTNNNFQVVTTIGRNWLRRRHAQILEAMSASMLEAMETMKLGDAVAAGDTITRALQRMERDLFQLENDLMVAR